MILIYISTIIKINYKEGNEIMTSEYKPIQYCLDPTELAWSVEVVAGKFLKPLVFEPGLYIGNSRTPSILFNGKFYSIVPTRNGISNIPINSISDVVGNIYDENNRVVYSVKSGFNISDSPAVPIRGLAIINAYIDKIILDNSIWVKYAKRDTEDISIKCSNPDIDDIWKDFILPEYADNYQVYELIERIIYEIYERLIHFIGSNKWIIHYKSKPYGCGDTNDILIEKYGDYRIDAWMKEHGDEYK